jgi:carboxymethylenebutenolidase
MNRPSVSRVRRRTSAPTFPALRFLLPLTSALALAGFGVVADRPARAGEVQAAPVVAPAEAAVALDVVESKGSYESQGKTISIETYEPKAPGKYPAVLVIHGAGGMTIGGPLFRESARLLAKRGYVAHIVHYFDLTGTKIADLPTMKANFPAWMKAVADGVTNVSKQKNVDPDRVGLLGFSLGSYLSLSLSMYDPRVLAVVEYFGGLPDVLVKDVKTLPPTLILHGDADRIVPVSEAKALEKLFQEKKVPYEVCIYQGQGHGFLGEPGLDAIRRSLAFFDKHVKSARPAAPKRATSAVPSPETYAGLAKG